MFPLSLYRNESSIGERTLYKTLLLIRILRKTVRQEQIQDTKSTRNRTSVFTTELNKRVHESKQCIPSLFTCIEPACFLSLYRNESSIGERTLYKTLLLIRILRKTVRQEQIQDTKSTRNRTSVFTTELNKRVHESKQCIPSLFTCIEPACFLSHFIEMKVQLGSVPFTKLFF